MIIASNDEAELRRQFESQGEDLIRDKLSNGRLPGMERLAEKWLTEKRVQSDAKLAASAAASFRMSRNANLIALLALIVAIVALIR